MKICFFCEHCFQEAGSAYSEYTWDPGGIGCSKAYWNIPGDTPNLVDVGKELVRAETCPDYTPAKGVPA